MLGCALYYNWDKWEMKEFLNDNVSNGFKDGVRWFKQQGKSIDKLFSGMFRRSMNPNVVNLPQYQVSGSTSTNNSFKAFSSDGKNNNSAINGYLATAGSVIGGFSQVMNESSIIKFNNAAPAGYFASNYNGTLRYWSEAFKGGTKAGIPYSTVQTAKTTSNSLKLASKFGNYASYAGSYIGYYGAVENFVNGDYYGAVREGTANYVGIKLAATKGGTWGIGWTIGWNILGPMVTNSELYNRMFFGKNSTIYQDRERKNDWYESKIFKD